MAIAASPARPARPASAPRPTAEQAAAPDAAPGPFLWTRERYERAVDAGVLTSEDQVELIDGYLIARMPQNEARAVTTSLVAERLRAAFAGGHVREEKPISLSGLSEPEPDVAVVRGAARDYLGAHPEPSALLLLVEVADTSLARDRTVKAPLYAEAGVPEYWIVDLAGRCVEVYREPSGDAYASKTTVRDGGSVAPLHAPESSVPVADLLP